MCRNIHLLSLLVNEGQCVLGHFQHWGHSRDVQAFERGIHKQSFCPSRMQDREHLRPKNGAKIMDISKLVCGYYFMVH